MNKVRIFLVVLCTAACNYAYSQDIGGIIRSVTKDVRTATGSITEMDGNIHIEGMGNRKTYEMSGGTLHIEGANNEVKIKGFVSKVIIEGAGNVVYVDKVNHVSIMGAGVKVYYKKTDNKNGRPSSKIEGVSSAVIKQK